MNQAALMTDRQEVGETLEPVMEQLKGIVEGVVQQQYEQCMKKGFDLPKYYIHIFIIKDPMASRGLDIQNVLKIRSPHVRITRPSPYQDQDHYLWSVTNYSQIKFEWCIPTKEVMNYILANPNKFDKSYVKMLRDFSKDKIEKLEDYVIDGKVQ